MKRYYLKQSKMQFQYFYDRIQIVVCFNYQRILQLQLKTKYNIFFLQTNFKTMKKTFQNLIVAVQSRSSSLKRSSKTINTYINKVPCNKDELNKPSQASIFIQNQMKEYPIPQKPKVSKREMLLAQKIKMTLQSNQKKFSELISKLEQKLTFLQLEQMRQVLQNMKQKQVNENKTGLKKLKYIVNYFLESSQQINQIQDYVVQSATKLIEQIKQAQKKRFNQLV